MAKEYIAKESTSQAILTKATETDTAVDGIVGKVGETNDSSGSATSGGIFAKLNKVITDTTSLLTRLTTARAASLDRIGSNGDSGNDTLFGVLSQGTNIEPDVKEFLNSTVGTDSFKSLDKLIEEKIATSQKRKLRKIEIAITKTKNLYKHTGSGVLRSFRVYTGSGFAVDNPKLKVDDIAIVKYDASGRENFQFSEAFSYFALSKDFGSYIDYEKVGSSYFGLTGFLYDAGPDDTIKDSEWFDISFSNSITFSFDANSMAGTPSASSKVEFLVEETV